MKSCGFSLFPTAIGSCALAWSPAGICAVHLPEADEGVLRERMREAWPGYPEIPDHAAWPESVRDAVDRTTALLAGRSGADGALDDLRSIPLDMSGVTPFRRRVYEATRKIAPGTTLTYGQLAAKLGKPSAARAVGQALGANPFAPIVPCHRVVGAGHRLGGFSAEGGAEAKLRMLQIEHAQI